MDRISKLSSLCNNSKIVCDIGCDHAYVLIDAIKNHNVIKGIAADINEGPLKQAKKNIISANLIDNISLVLSDGFDNINDDFDTAIIAGMGGSLIAEILEKGLAKIKNKKLIIEANNDSYKVREFLINNNFNIIEEYAINDSNKYYEIMVAVTGNAKYDIYDIKYGYHLRREKNEAFINHYTEKYNLLCDVITKITNQEQKEEKLITFRELISILSPAVVEKNYILDTLNYYESYFIDDLPRPTIFVSPGGGYLYCSPRESHTIAKEFLNLGYNVIVVNYRVTNEEKYPKTAQYYAHVIKKYRNDKRISKFISLGFSAGGHNALEVQLHYKNYGLDAKCDLLMLGYPVVTADERYWHIGSFKNLLKDDFDNLELRNYLSLEKEVNDEAPDLFLWTTLTDESVPCMNSLLLVEAYKAHNRNVEFHMFPMGGHGLSTANFDFSEGNLDKIYPYIAKWINLCDEWIKNKIKD